MSSRGPNLSQYPTSFLSLGGGPQIRPYFFMACLHQDPDWWKRAQLLLAGDVESNPGTMWYCAIRTHKINSYQTSIQCNHTTPHWIHLKCSHIKLKSYSPSFICHTHQIPIPKTPPHIHNLTQKPSTHIEKPNKPPKTNQLPL